MKINWPWLRVETFHRAGFISMLGCTLSWKDLRWYGKLYGERKGFTRCWQVGRWLWTWRNKRSGYHW